MHSENARNAANVRAIQGCNYHSMSKPGTSIRKSLETTSVFSAAWMEQTPLLPGARELDHVREFIFRRTLG